MQPYYFTFGAGSRACTVSNLSNCILYVFLTSVCILCKVHGDPSRTPDFDYLNYAADRTAQTYWPEEFGVQLEARDVAILEACMWDSKSKCQEELGLGWDTPSNIVPEHEK